MVEVKNLSGFSINEKNLKRIANKVLSKEGHSESKISLALVTAEKIKELNNRYMGREYPTDVLSFSDGRDKNNESFIIPPAEEFDFYLGEVIICPSQVKKYTDKNNVSFQEQLARVLIHGVLHLLGYDHEESKKEAEKQKQKEKNYLNNIKI